MSKKSKHKMSEQPTVETEQPTVETEQPIVETVKTEPKKRRSKDLSKLKPGDAIIVNYRDVGEIECEFVRMIGDSKVGFKHSTYAPGGRFTNVSNVSVE